MSPRRYVPYYRVSGRGQARSGLGLDAQRAAIAAYVGTEGVILGEFTEIESGRYSDRYRPALRNAIELCRKKGATLIVAKLDRLARNVAFTAALLRSDMEFVVADMPLANRFTLHIIAAFAEYEHTLMCERIQAAHAAARAQGRRIGRGFPNKEAVLRAVAKGNAVLKAKSDAFAAKMAEHFRELRSAGITSARGMAIALNNRGLPGLRGGKWHSDTVQAVDRRGEHVLDNSRNWARTAVALQARGLVKTIRRIRAKGVRSYQGIAKQLTVQNVPSPNGRAWSPKRVQRLEAWGERWTEKSHPHLSESARSKLIKILPVANDLMSRGVTDYASIAKALNDRCVPPPNNSKLWTRNQVGNCLSLIVR
jgi:DNA invertase Pin-like site-specific DNA recombinase